MIQSKRHNFLVGLVIALLTVISLVLLGTASAGTTKAQTTRHSKANDSVIQQPLYTDYRGVKVGMSVAQVRTQLGAPLQYDNDIDIYAFSDTELTQIAYDAAHTVKTISVDYVGGAGAPDYKSVVGSDVELKPDGSIYKLVRYEGLGLWVYYNRTAGPVPVVTITLQKSLVNH